MESIKLLWKNMKGSRLLYIAAIISIGLATIFTIMGPLIIKTTIDSIIGNDPIESSYVLKAINYLGGIQYLKNNLWFIGIILISLTILRGLFLYYKTKWSAVSAESTAKNMRERLYNHLQHLPYEYHVKAETGDLIQRCTSDVDTIRRFLSVQFVEIGRAIFMITIIAYIMFNLDVKLALVSMASIPIVFLFALIFFTKVKTAFRASDEAEGSLSTVLQENLTGVRVVRAFGREIYEVEKFDKKNVRYRDLTYRVIRLLAWYWAFSDLLCMLQIGTVLVVGVYWTYTGNISLGTLVAFSTYEGLILWPVRQMGRILADMGKALVAVERIQNIFDENIEIMEENHQCPSIKGNISFKNVYFEYEENKPVLNNISFNIKAGQTIAILGSTGSGKSSLIHLLARLYHYQKGSIKIDGIELKNIDKKWIRKNVGIVLQEPFLYAKSIKDNIGVANPSVSHHKIVEAARIASIHDVIMEFEKGYDTPVGERGVSLSGGQKQRIAIARTLINECPILVFDDSLSAVDTETDLAIRKSLNMMKNKTTTFIISHRISTLSEADLILVLDKGKLVQSGTHNELINQNGLYKRIWIIQNSIEEEYDKNIKISN